MKNSLVALKISRKIGNLPAWLGDTLIRSARMAKESQNLVDLTSVLGDINALAKTRSGCNLLSKTRDATSLKRMAIFAETFGANSAALYRIGGDLVVNSAQQAGKKGAETIQLAATFGQSGLRLLDKVGAIKFTKFSTRASRIGYKGDIFHVVARLLLMVPTCVLYAIIAICVVTWLPWRGLNQLSKVILNRDKLGT